MILVIDNFDSFVHNLARYIRRLGPETLVLRNDDPKLDQVESLQPAAIVISPGPQTPDVAGKTLQVIAAAYGKIPLIGICLGHQAIAAHHQVPIVRADQPMHGRVSAIQHSDHAMFAGTPRQFQVCRYHSLVVERTNCGSGWPDQLDVTAEGENGEVMAFADDRNRAYGVQFHPEAILTQFGYQVLANMLQLCQVELAEDAVDQVSVPSNYRFMEFAE